MSKVLELYAVATDAQADRLEHVDNTRALRLSESKMFENS